MLSSNYRPKVWVSSWSLLERRSPSGLHGGPCLPLASMVTFPWDFYSSCYQAAACNPTKLRREKAGAEERGRRGEEEGGREINWRIFLLPPIRGGDSRKPNPFRYMLASAKKSIHKKHLEATSAWQSGYIFRREWFDQLIAVQVILCKYSLGLHACSLLCKNTTA